LGRASQWVDEVAVAKSVMRITKMTLSDLSEATKKTANSEEAKAKKVRLRR
jgi:hypothetical protein